MRYTWLLLLLLLSPAPLYAQGQLAGVLVDPGSRLPLPCVDVVLEDSAAHQIARTETTGDGAFQFDSPPAGSYRPRFSLWGHPSVYGAFETLDSTTQHARVYQVDFGEGKFDPNHKPDAMEAPPKPRRMAKGPVYPPELRERGVQGVATMSFVVDSVGRIVPPTLRVIDATHPAFADAVLQFLREAQFEPARRAGRPACALVTKQTFTFGLR